MEKVTQYQAEVVDFFKGLDIETAGIYLAGAVVASVVGGFVWVRYLKGPLTGFGRGSAGFQTNVRKAMVPNPNKREFVEVDLRHLYQNKEPAAEPEPEFDTRSTKKTYDEDWIPEGHAKAKSDGSRKRKGGKK